MYSFRILHMYPEMLNLYGDSGNIEILQYRSEKRNILCQVDRHCLGMKAPDFSKYDLIYLGGGADFEQHLLSADLLKCKTGIRTAYENHAFFLLICGGYQLMGKYYQDAKGTKIPGLGLFPYYTIASGNTSKRCIGNIVIEANIGGKDTKIIGFENHSGITKGSLHPFGRTLIGNGNCVKGRYEGYFEQNVIATYLHGPLLSKNPVLADYILQYCISRRAHHQVPLSPFDDTLEKECRKALFHRILKH